MYRLLLFTQDTHVDDIPRWWMNFMERNWNRSFDTPDAINEFLEPMGARFFTTKTSGQNWGDRYLEFESEEAAIMFMLREAR